MPICFKESTDTYQIYVWKCDESLDELKKIRVLEPKIVSRLDDFKSESRKMQFLATRILLDLALGKHEIKYEGDGKPYLSKDGRHISITHDNEYAGIMVSQFACGIDIQEVSDKLKKVSHKFLNANDFNGKYEELEVLTKIWAAKESLYKVNGDPMVFFKEHMIVEQKNDNLLTGSIIHNKYGGDYQMKIHKLEKYYLVYTI